MTAPTTTVVAEAQDPIQAQIWVDALRDHGIKASSFERGVGGALGGAVTSGFASYPIIVATNDLAAARNVIADLDGAVHLAPIRDSAASQAAQKRALTVAAAIAVGVLVLGVLARIVAG
jgi:hypothetical protein